MYRPNYSPNAYIPGGQFVSPGDGGFKTPAARPRFQSSPQYHQQQQQHQLKSPRPNTPGSGGGRPDYYGRDHTSPMPMGSPHRSFGDYSPNSYMGRQDRGGPGNRGCMGGRGNPDQYGRGRGWKTNFRNMMSPRGGDLDCNPGGSDDMRLYFSPDMLSDPWASLSPVPVPHHKVNSTTT